MIDLKVASSMPTSHHLNECCKAKTASGCDVAELDQRFDKIDSKFDQQNSNVLAAAAGTVVVDLLTIVFMSTHSFNCLCVSVVGRS